VRNSMAFHPFSFFGVFLPSFIFHWSFCQVFLFSLQKLVGTYMGSPLSLPQYNQFKPSILLPV